MATAAQGISPEEYLRGERESASRSEYLDGQVYAMTGAGYAHNQIVGNLVGETRSRLRGRGCSVLPSDLRVFVPAGFYTYPDVTVVCGAPEFTDPRKDTLRNPLVLFEVLSPSTEAYDRGRKFASYRALPSLREYVLVSSISPLVERFLRDGDGWVLQDAQGVAASIQLVSLGIELPLSEIYLGVELPPETPQP